jgi:hypothetical protein
MANVSAFAVGALRRPLEQPQDFRIAPADASRLSLQEDIRYPRM